MMGSLRSRSFLLLLAVASLLAIGCRKKIVVNDIVVYEKYWKQAVREVTPRSVFEMDCPADQLDFALLKRQGRMPIRVVARGCDVIALYERPIVRASTNLGGIGWAIDNWQLAKLREASEATEDLMSGDGGD